MQLTDYELAVLINALRTYKNIIDNLPEDEMQEYTDLESKLMKEYVSISGEGFETE